MIDRRYTDSYAAETEDGPMAVRPMDTLLSTAMMVPRDSWQKCPKCGLACPLFFGNPDGEYWCAVCQAEREIPEVEPPAGAS